MKNRGKTDHPIEQYPTLAGLEAVNIHSRANTQKLIKIGKTSAKIEHLLKLKIGRQRYKIS